MIAYPYAALATGVLLTLAGGCALFRHFLLEPISTHYPKAPAFLRASVFLFGAALIFVGMKFLWTFVVGGPNTYPPQPSPYTQFLSLMVFYYKASMLANILLQRYPPDTWRRLDRMYAVLCPKRRP